MITANLWNLIGIMALVVIFTLVIAREQHE